MRIFNTIFGKIATYLVAVGFVFAILFFIIYLYRTKSEKQVLATFQNQFKREVTQLFNYNSSQMMEIVNDYSYWDEFVVAIKTCDTKWFNSNITLANSFNFNKVCVYDKDFNLIYHFPNKGKECNSFFSKNALHSIEKSKINHFFISSSNELTEVGLTSIHPSNDPQHSKSLPSGYLIVGRKLDMVYLKKMTKLIGVDVQLVPNAGSIHPTSRDNITARIHLQSWNGKQIASLAFTQRENHNFATIKLLSFIVMLLFFALLLTFIVFIRIYIDRPLKLTTDILESEDKNSITLLKGYHNEFGRIGNLFELFVKQKAELRLANEKAQESDRLKSAFLANMSHEIRTPMNGIMGFTELLKKSNVNSEEYKNYLEIIENSGIRLLNVVNNIIDVSKIESGTIEVTNKVTNINEQLDYIASFFAPEIEKKGLRCFHSKSLPNEKAFIWTDTEKLYGILINLVNNAIKHTDKGSIEIGYKIKNEAEQSFIEFYVTDSGDGIPPDKSTQIFNRFIQVDMSLKTNYQGAGLGLSIAKAYVELLGGKIWVESTYNVGSTFRFLIPYNRIETESTVEHKQQAPIKEKTLSQQLKILVVEDDAGMEFLLLETIKEICDEPLVARNGVDALEMSKNNPDIDLILMDIRIPQMDGYETTEAIRLFNKEVVIIAQTACAFASDEEKAYEVGCNDYVSKPIDTDKFELIIEKHFAAK